MKVMVETSARHVHVSEADLKTLFGADAKLTVKKELSQPGQYASNEKVEVVGPKGSLVMSILGPTRPETQVEVALTDARKLGIAAPIRESGDLEGTPGCTLKGPAGEVVIEKALSQQSATSTSTWKRQRQPVWKTSRSSPLRSARKASAA